MWTQDDYGRLTRSYGKTVETIHNRDAAVDLLNSAERRIAMLEVALRDVTSCLTEHLQQEAHDENVKVEALCTCYANEVSHALSLLKK